MGELSAYDRKWFESHLNARKQLVVINETLSSLVVWCPTRLRTRYKIFTINTLSIADIARKYNLDLLAPAVTVGETEGAMDSTSVFFASSFAYNFVRK